MIFALALILAPGCPREPKVLLGHAVPLPDGAEVVCAVRGERCAKSPDTEAAVYEGRTFYFCSDGARREFLKDPERFAYGSKP